MYGQQDTGFGFCTRLRNWNLYTTSIRDASSLDNHFQRSTTASWRLLKPWYSSKSIRISNFNSVRPWGSPSHIPNLTRADSVAVCPNVFQRGMLTTHVAGWWIFNRVTFNFCCHNAHGFATITNWPFRVISWSRWRWNHFMTHKGILLSQPPITLFKILYTLFYSASLQILTHREWWNVRGHYNS